MSFRLTLDPRNPGQFYAACGVFELASRVDDAVHAHFTRAEMVVNGGPELEVLIRAWCEAPLQALDEHDKTATRILVGAPFNLRLDWWKDPSARALKVWAGTMECLRIARAMNAAISSFDVVDEGLLERGQVVYDPLEPTKKVEPYYFDARRAPNADARDTGFSANDLKLTTLAHPAVEVLCLVGLQRFRPSPLATKERRNLFDYCTWSEPLPIAVASAVAAAAVPMKGTSTYRFESWYRTSQRKHKAFRPAVALG